METRKLLFLGGGVVALLLVSLLIFSQLIAQNDAQLTQADFVNMLIKALGLEDELGVTATMMDKVNKLRELGYAPLGGWEPERPLLKGDVAVVLAQILGIDMPAGAMPEDYVQALADRDIMTPGGAGETFSMEDLTTAINAAAAMPGVGLTEIPPYRTPVSPVQ